MDYTQGFTLPRRVPIQLPRPVLILSDGTGNTAEKVVRAGLRQFVGHLVFVRTYPYVTQREQLLKLFRSAQRQKALVVTTLVRHDMRAVAVEYSRQLGVPHIDLIEPLLTELASFFEESPSGVPGLLHQADEHYFRRIEAVEFTVKADDGKEPRMLKEADIILAGVSRTSKTPLSTFLAHKGYKVGNVPIVLDRPPPDELFLVDQRRVFALTISPDALVEIRRARLQTMGLSERTNYGDIDYVLAEIEYANQLFRGNREWPVVDVTNKAIEETAATIIGLLRSLGLSDPDGEVSQL